VTIGAVYVAIALLGALLQAGGFSGLASLLSAIAGGQQMLPETYGMAWVITSGLVTTSAVGIYLILVRQPTRRGSSVDIQNRPLIDP